MPNTSSVFVISVNGTVHSVVSDPIEAEKIMRSVPGATLDKHPLISKQAGPGVGVTETDLSFLDELLDDLAGDGEEESEEIDFDAEYPMSDNTDAENSPEEEETDVVCMDVELTAKLLEYIKRAGDSVDTHGLAERAGRLSTEIDEVLTVDHFSQIVEPDSESSYYAGSDDEFDDNQSQSLPPADTDDDATQSDIEQQMRNRGITEQKVDTLADFIGELEKSGTAAPTIKDIFKKKRQQAADTMIRSEVAQDSKTTVFKVLNTLTDKK